MVRIRNRLRRKTRFDQLGAKKRLGKKIAGHGGWAIDTLKNYQGYFASPDCRRPIAFDLLQTAHHFQRLLDALNRMNRQAFDGFFRRIGLGHDGHAETQFGRLL